MGLILRDASDRQGNQTRGQSSTPMLTLGRPEKTKVTTQEGQRCHSKVANCNRQPRSTERQEIQKESRSERTTRHQQGQQGCNSHKAAKGFAFTQSFRPKQTSAARQRTTFRIHTGGSRPLDRPNLATMRLAKGSHWKDDAIDAEQ